jgi:ribosome biogenesis GTPase
VPIKEISSDNLKSNADIGRILKRMGDRFLVHCDPQEVVCAVRKTVTKSALSPVVGDWVRFSPIDDDTGVIEQVLERRTSLSRTASGPKPRPQVLLSNLDLLVVVASVAEPPPNPRLIDRFLVMAEFSQLDSLIIWNKIDLLASTSTIPPCYCRGGLRGGTAGEVTGNFLLYQRYHHIGYPNLMTCALTGQGVDDLREQISGRTSMFIGASGVGKTSLLNQLQPGLAQKIAAISQSTGKGTHATSTTEIFPLNNDTFIADSPGVREFALWGVTRQDLAPCFPEFLPLIPNCRFRDCLHDQEIGCAVKDAVEQGMIDRERWDSYVRILKSLPLESKR